MNADTPPPQELPESATAEDQPILDPKLVLAEVLDARARGESLISEIGEQNHLAARQVAEIQQKITELDSTKSTVQNDALAVHHAAESSQQQVEEAKGIVAEANALIASLRATVAQVNERTASSSASLESIKAIAATATGAASRVEALKVQVEQSAQVAAQRSQHIEEGRQYVDSKRAEIDVLLNRAQQSASGADAQLQAARTATESVTMLHASVQALKASIEQAAKSVAELQSQSEVNAAATKHLADAAKDTDARISAYEKRLAELGELAATRLRTIESLLPGATSAGLASAFGRRRSYYKWPQRFWQGVFICGVLALLACAIKLPDVATDATLSWNRLGMALLHRLPFALPLIWLAIHAAHKAALAQRVEEDYAFKETISRSFEGYRREMAELEVNGTPDSPLGRLCSDTLSTISRHPGMIYEKHPLTKTPLNTLSESVGPIAEAAAKLPQVKISGPQAL
jgi:hypothetical protein